MSAVYDVIQACARMIEEQETKYGPTPSGIRASHKVPFGRYYKQWDTNGRLWWWVSRGWLYDGIAMHTMKWDASIAVRDIRGVWGIPVYHVD